MDTMKSHKWNGHRSVLLAVAVGMLFSQSAGATIPPQDASSKIDIAVSPVVLPQNIVVPSNIPLNFTITNVGETTTALGRLSLRVTRDGVQVFQQEAILRARLTVGQATTSGFRNIPIQQAGVYVFTAEAWTISSDANPAPLPEAHADNNSQTVTQQLGAAAPPAEPVVVNLMLGDAGVVISGQAPYRVNENRNITIAVRNNNAANITINPNQYSLALLVTRPGQAVQRIVAANRPNLPPNSSTGVVFNNVSLGASAGELCLDMELLHVNTPNYTDDPEHGHFASPVCNTIIDPAAEAPPAPAPRIDIRPTQFYIVSGRTLTPLVSGMAAGAGKTIGVDVANQGAAGTTIDRYTVTLRVNGQQVGQPLSNNPGAGLVTGNGRARFTSFTDVTLVEGENALEATAAVTGNQTEAAEDQANNVLTRSVQLVSAAPPPAPRIDIRPSSFNIAAGTVAGSGKRVDVLVGNDGAAGTTIAAYTVTLRVNGVQVGQPISGANLAAGPAASQWKQFLTATLVEGENALEATAAVTGNQVEPEDAQGNNTFAQQSRAIAAPAGPAPPPRIDIRPTAITIPPGTLAGPGKTVTVNVINEGAAGTSIAAYTVALRLGGVAVGNPQNGAALAAGGAGRPFTFNNVTLVEGDNAFEATATVTGNQVESAEDQADNTLPQSFQIAAVPVPRIDIRPSSFNIPAGAVAGSGNGNRVDVLVGNEGAAGTTIAAYTVTLRVNGVQAGQPVNGANLAAGGGAAVWKQFNNVTLVEGENALEATAAVTGNQTEPADAVGNNIFAQQSRQIAAPAGPAPPPRIDIRPTAITIPPGTLAGPGKTVTVNVINEGAAGTTIAAYTVALRLGGVAVGNPQNGAALAAGGAGRPFTFNNVTLVAGDNAFEATATVTGNQVESAEDQADNTLPQSYQIAAVPVPRIDIRPSLFGITAGTVSGSGKRVDVLVVNDGDAGTTIAAYTVTLRVNGVQVGQPVNGANLPAGGGASKWTQFTPVTLVAGDNALEATVAVTGNQTEPGDATGNNIFAQNQQIAAAPVAPAPPAARLDIHPTTITVPNVVAGSGKTATVQVVNTGDAGTTVASYTVALKVNGVDAGQLQNGANLAVGGAGRPFTFDNLTLAEGVLLFEATTTVTGNQTESANDQVNNTLGQQVRINPAPVARLDIRPTLIAVPAGTVAGSGKTVTVTVINEGDAGTTIAAYTVSLKVDGVAAGQPQNGANLAVGGAGQTVTFNDITLTEGVRTFEATATVTGNQTESANDIVDDITTQQIRILAPIPPVNLGVAGITLSGVAPYIVGTNRNVTIQISNPSAVAITANQYTLNLLVTQPGQPESTVAVARFNLPAGVTTNVPYNNFNLGAAGGDLQMNAVIALANVPNFDDPANNTLAAPASFRIIAPRINIHPNTITVPDGTLSGTGKTLNVTVINSGDAGTTIASYTIALRVNGVAVGQPKNGANLAVGGAGQSFTFDNVTLVEGANACEATATVTGNQVEPVDNQGDNIFPQSISVAAPEVVPPITWTTVLTPAIVRAIGWPGLPAGQAPQWLIDLATPANNHSLNTVFTSVTTLPGDGRCAGCHGGSNPFGNEAVTFPLSARRRDIIDRKFRTIDHRGPFMKRWLDAWVTQGEQH